MNSFITKENTIINLPKNILLDECEESDNHSKLLCFDEYVASLAKRDFDKAKEMCNLLGEERMVSECKFYMTIPYIMDLEKSTKEKINFIMDFCDKEFSDSRWKSECYYQLADELAIMKNSENYLSDIASACAKSDQAKYYKCDIHVAENLPVGTAEKFCDISGYKSHCYFGVGTNFFNETHNVSDAIQECNFVKEDFKQNCFNGMSLAAGIYYYKMKDVSKNIEFCNSIPLDNAGKSTCFQFIGFMSIFFSKKDFMNGINNCKLFPANFQTNCFYGLISYNLLELGGNVENQTYNCNLFPAEFKQACLLELNEFLIF